LFLFLHLFQYRFVTKASHWKKAACIPCSVTFAGALMPLRYKLALAGLNLALLPVDWMIIRAKPETLLVAHIAIALTFHLLFAGVGTIIARRRYRARLRAAWKRERR
jgi:hypothetical protein